MPKITIVGAGGYVFPLTLVRDILAFEALQESESACTTSTRTGWRSPPAGAQRLIDVHGLGAKVTVPVSAREALSGADFVICTFQVGGIEAYSYDVNVPREFGVDQPVGDTFGPGRGFPGLALGRRAERDRRRHPCVCPDALLIQYANPMSINCWASSSLG